MAKIVTDANFNSEVLEHKGVVLIDFFADWCGPCKMLSPLIDELAEEMKGKAKIVKIDVDNAGETAKKYGIMSIPTLIIFKDGKLTDPKTGELFNNTPENLNKAKIMGVQDKNTLKNFIENALLN